MDCSPSSAWHISYYNCSLNLSLNSLKNTYFSLNEAVLTAFGDHLSYHHNYTTLLPAGWISFYIFNSCVSSSWSVHLEKCLKDSYAAPTGVLFICVISQISSPKFFTPFSKWLQMNVSCEKLSLIKRKSQPLKILNIKKNSIL